MIYFVCSLVGNDAGEDLDHIILRKEAERSTGTGQHARQFWWGIDAPLGRDVEVQANHNGGTLPVLFSKSINPKPPHCNQVQIWDRWHSVLYPHHHGRIPNNIIVASGHDPNHKRPYYALVCYSHVKLGLGHHGYCDLTQCRTAKNTKAIGYLVGARLLAKQPPLMTGLGTPSMSVRAIAFDAMLVGHCYVEVEQPKLLTQPEVDSLHQYKAGDDWQALAKRLRR